MKKSKWLAVIFATLLLFVTVSCAHTHEYGEWVLTTTPTETTAGKAERECECDEKEVVDVAVLTDTSVWTVATVNATCSNAGSNTYTSVYGQVVVTIPVVEHSYGSWTLTADPTATTQGKAERTCSVGNEKEEVDVAVLTDTSVWTLTTVNATCTTAGSNTYTSIYGQVVVTIPVLEHSYGEWTLTTDPTATTQGKAERTCSVGNEKEEVDVAVLTDTSVWTLVTVNATCSNAGSNTYTSIYGQVVVTIPVLEHTYGSWTLTTEPTTTAQGKAERTCSVCSHKDEVDVAVLTDTSVWTVATVNATCSTTGTSTYTSVYGQVVVTLPIVEHTYGEWTLTTDPTTTAQGKAERTCSVGNEKEEVDVAVLTDTSVWTLVTIDATCTVAGSNTYTSIYGQVVFTIPTLEHSYGEWTLTTDPTATTVGKAERTCSVGNEKEEVDVAVLTDTSVWAVATVDATCTEEGTNTYTSIYGQVVVTIPVLEHPYGEWTLTTEPTATTVGKAERTCSVCSHNDEVDVAVLTDTSVWTVATVDATCTATGTSTYTSIYGEVVVTLPVAEHPYSEWTLTTDPTEATQGKAERTCTVCGDKEEVDVAVLTDTSVWTKQVATAPTYSQTGSDQYTSVYGVVTVEVPALVIPYLNKTYSSFALDADSDGAYKNGTVSMGSSWVNATLVVDENGQGTGTAYPFRETFDFTLLDEQTGQMQMVSGSSIYGAYLDFESGIIVRIANINISNSYNYVFVMTPFEVGVASSNVSASSWDNAMAISYTFDGTTYQMLILNERVYFGVTFEDQNGDAVLPANCYNSPYLYVKDSSGNLISGFVYNGTKLVAVDGYEGTYTNDDQTLVISGHGGLTYNGIDGTYQLTTEGETFTANVYCDNKYYELILDKANYTFTVYQPMVTVTLNAGTQASFNPESVNKNIAYQLPTPTHDDYVFRGWFYDAELTQAVTSEFIPTTDVTLFASWKQKVTINLEGVATGDDTVIYIGDNETLEQFLPQYDVIEENGQLKKFAGWYWNNPSTETYEAFPLNAPVPASASGITIYATWEYLPAYYGVYLGNEIWGTTSGNNSSNTITITIDAEGNITSNKSSLNGKVTNYDKATQVITWVNSSSATKYLWFDEESGVIATQYNSHTEIGTDFYIASKYQETNILGGHYGINAPKEPGSTSTGVYARVIDLTTKTGQSTIFVYNNHIYSHVSIKDAAGGTLNSSNVGDSKTLVVVDLSTNTFVIALASTGDSFASQSKTIVLDQYFGTYTNGDQSVVLDGTGIITYGEKTGKYTKTAEGATYGFDVYFENDTENVYDDEYYRLTLSGETFNIEKVMVAVTFVVGEQFIAVPERQYNINVQGILPDASAEGWVFNGWYYDEAFMQKVETFIPTEPQTLYAKHSAPAVLTINYNDNETTPSESITYSVNDIVTLEIPLYDKHVFAGWFTTPTFDDGTEWTSGSAITQDTVIYAKWDTAPIYNNYYVTTKVSDKEANGGLSKIDTRTGGILNVDPYGKAPSSSYPFYYTGGWEITDYNSITGSLRISKVGGTEYYYGFIDLTSGIIIVNDSLDTIGASTSDMDEVIFLNPFETGNMSGKILSSYWNSGKIRAIQYTYDNNTYTAFIMNNQVYFNVKFVDSANQPVQANACYQAESLYVYGSNDDLIGKFGYDGTTMQQLDGYEGTYTNAESTLVVNGVNKVTYDSVEGSYTIAYVGQHTIDAYVGTEFLEFTLNVNDKTFTVEKPYVTITFNGGTQATLEAQSVNKNIAITLPTPTNDDYVFRGWYVTDPTELLDSNYIPTVDITLNAKWDLFVTLTLVVGNSYQNVVTTYGAGDTVVLPTYEKTNEQIFTGWYSDSTFETPYTETIIEANTTIYGKWEEPSIFSGSYKGFNAYMLNSIGANKELVIDDFGKIVSGSRVEGGTITNYDSDTGTFRIYTSADAYYFGYYDADLEMIAYNHYSRTDSFGNDVYIYFKGEPIITDLMTRSLDTSNAIRLVNFTHDGTPTTLLVYNRKVYYDVVYTYTPESNLEFNELNTANTFIVTNKIGTVIVELEREGLGLIVKTQ